MDFAIDKELLHKEGHEMSIVENYESGLKKGNPSFLKLRVKVMSFESNKD
jgi:hypothetical protein